MPTAAPATSTGTTSKRALRSPHSIDRRRRAARCEVLEAFAAGRKHGVHFRDGHDAFIYLCGWLGIAGEKVDEILGRGRA